MLDRVFHHRPDSRPAKVDKPGKVIQHNPAAVVRVGGERRIGEESGPSARHLSEDDSHILSVVEALNLQVLEEARLLGWDQGRELEELRHRDPVQVAYGVVVSTVQQRECAQLGRFKTNVDRIEREVEAGRC